MADLELGLQLKMARLRAKFEQADVAQRLGTHRVQVSKWERGVNVPGEDTLKRLAEMYGTTVQELTRNAKSVSRETRTVREGAPVQDSWTPNPRFDSLLPERAYQVALGYLRRLERAGLPSEQIDEAERLMLDANYSKLNKRDRAAASEEDWIQLVDATWEIIREVLSWQGVRP